ncbi:sigma-70 family RNA polymerase sigma factor [Nocardia sp. NEAU-G5]|uniref:Sigma-70 family RNA polymerase sigma factor n=1 Tax=Nocardia albiluteola TaxID=2842303 RepID=A0ABS6AZ00_9NOCA|nr:sigma-70 family RNA polymerase sigma factor [Nocardia albiluteola]MBU3062760.1 sigma-70 family RNA polymerase sigma factor [Nocardia albiluteola]
MPDAPGTCTPPPAAPVGGSVRARTAESEPPAAGTHSAPSDRRDTPLPERPGHDAPATGLGASAPDPERATGSDPGRDASSPQAQLDSSRVSNGSAGTPHRPETTTGAHAEVAYLLRELAPIVVGVLARRFGDFDAAEDAVQEAMLAAATQWPDAGLPDNPRGWLIQVAQRRMTDTVRADAARRHREIAVAVRDMEQHNDIQPARDDTLTLFVLCCHPSLSPASAIALTLRAVGGLSTEEIARAFLIPESTMAQRISRAKKRLSTLERPFAMPPALAATAWRDRRESVLQVLYVMFTEGHTASGGPSLQRTDLSAEAIRLARMVHRLLPDDPEVTALLALMLLTDARRAARTGTSGELIPLPEQDRTRWHRGQLAEGIRLTTAAISAGLEGPYRIQASIAALHAQARHAEDTDWDRILLLYTRLECLTPNPMVTLNRAVATAMVHGPAAGLSVTDTVADILTGNHRLDAVRAHLQDMAGDRQAAIAGYTAAAHHTASTPERDYLTLRAARLRNRDTA